VYLLLVPTPTVTPRMVFALTNDNPNFCSIIKNRQIVSETSWADYCLPFKACVLYNYNEISFVTLCMGIRYFCKCNLHSTTNIFYDLIVLNKCLLYLYKYKLDAETKVTKRFRNPRAWGCSVPSEARVLLRARGFLNRLVTVGRGV